jgi:hypothetical protein
MTGFVLDRLDDGQLRNPSDQGTGGIAPQGMASRTNSLGFSQVVEPNFSDGTKPLRPHGVEADRPDHVYRARQPVAATSLGVVGQGPERVSRIEFESLLLLGDPTLKAVEGRQKCA